MQDAWPQYGKASTNGAFRLWHPGGSPPMKAILRQAY
jgi:hypothetical protein